MDTNRIDSIRPDAPELAARGPRAIGVRTLTLTDPDRIDVLNTTSAANPARYDRVLTVELWYPAAPGQEGDTAYRDVFIRDGVTRCTLHGSAVRDAAPDMDAGSCPLAIISHGYPGNRFLMSHIAEHLASYGYVVASIDHTESTYDNQQAFGSTLVNRPLDQLFVLDALARLNTDASDPLAGLVETERTAIIGYSMGGYGALVTAGCGVSELAVAHENSAPDGLLGLHRAGGASHAALFDSRIRTVVAFAPWGFNHGFFDAGGMAGLRVPTLFIAGGADTTSGYETGVRAMFETATGADRSLLTFANAGHNVAAPIPAPAESWAASPHLEFVPFEHYADAVWDTVRMNNIAQHFITAWFGYHLRGDTATLRYLQQGRDGALEGFADNIAPGIRLESRKAGG